MPKRKLPRGWEDKVLAAVARGESVAAAARRAGVSRITVYRRLQRSSTFAQAFEDAYEEGTDRLEDAAYQLAIGGDRSLLMFLLKARRPERYRETLQVEHDIGKKLADALDRAAKEVAKAAQELPPTPSAGEGADGD